ncbi:MAG: hypothetical protein HYS33_04935 [Acidobacteria bacterium]|nr:hypothetical protein [Acidobacteriota bacterium]
MLLTLATTCKATSATGETVDRVVASVENVAITQSDVEKQYRLELFLSGQTPEAEPDSASLRYVRDRLVDQLLLQQEAETETGEMPDFFQAAAEAWEEVRAKYGNEELFRSALARLGMSEQEVLARLRVQERTLYLVDERLRPAAWAELSEIEEYYRETFVPEYERRGAGTPPPLEEVEGRIREILVQKKIDQLLPIWLEELRTGRRVKIHSF